MVEVKVKLEAPDQNHLAGILEQRDEGVSRGRPLALILHGTLAHKNQTYHRLLARKLAERGLDSFRFDFHAHHESPGTWRMVDTDKDMEDLLRVIDYLRQELGYNIVLIVAHSRGSAIAQRYLCLFDPTIPLFVNVSGRRRMEKIWDRWPVWKQQIEEKGSYDWHVKIAGEKITVPVTIEQIEEFAAYDNAFIESEFPQATHVLTCHGTADETVPVEDASLFHKAWSRRTPGTSTLRLIEGANHNHIGHYEELVSHILKSVHVGTSRALEVHEGHQPRYPVSDFFEKTR